MTVGFPRTARTGSADGVAAGDAGLGVLEDAPYDRAIVTIGSLDIPPA